MLLVSLYISGCHCSPFRHLSHSFILHFAQRKERPPSHPLHSTPLQSLLSFLLHNLLIYKLIEFCSAAFPPRRQGVPAGARHLSQSAPAWEMDRICRNMRDATFTQPLSRATGRPFIYFICPGQEKRRRRPAGRGRKEKGNEGGMMEGRKEGRARLGRPVY